MVELVCTFFAFFGGAPVRARQARRAIAPGLASLSLRAMWPSQADVAL